MKQRRSRIGREGLAARLLSVLLAVLILLSGPVYAHHAASPAKHSIDLSAYRLPDGSLPILCLGDDPTGSGQGDEASCPLCRISGAPALPSADSDYDICRFPTPLQFHPQTRQVLLPPVLLALAPPTGPPFS